MDKRRLQERKVPRVCDATIADQQQFSGVEDPEERVTVQCTNTGGAVCWLTLLAKPAKPPWSK